MNIRTKTFLITGLALLVGIFLILLFSFTFLTDSYINLEHQSIDNQLKIGLKDLSKDELRLNTSVGDWARWDETYDYVQGKSNNYEINNLNFESLNNLNINFLIYTDKNGSIIRALETDPTRKEILNLSPEISKRITTIPNFLSFTQDVASNSGYIILPKGPALIVASPIVTSVYKGPSVGYLIMGIIYDEERISKLSEKADLVGLIKVPNEHSLTKEYKNKLWPYSDGPLNSEATGYISCSTFIPTLDSRGTVLYSITRSADILKQGNETIKTFIISLLILCTVIVVISLVITDQLVIKRLNEVISRVKRRYQGYNDKKLLDEIPDDEFSELEKVIHPVILELNHTNEQLEDNIRKISESEKRYRSLADSLSKLANIVEHTSSGIVTGTGNIVDYVNPSYARMHGMEREELIEKNPFIVINSPEEGRFLNYLKKGLHTGHVTFEMDHTRIDGTIFPALHELTILSGDEPEYSIWTMNVHDITEHRLAWKALLDGEALKESARQLRDVISRLPDATFVIDKDGWVIFWNHAMEKISGILGESIIGRGRYEYSLPFYGIKRPMLLNLILEKDIITSDFFKNVTKSGDSFLAEESFPGMKNGGKSFSSMASPMYDSRGNIIGAIQSMRDITPRIMAEQALMMTNKKLQLLSGITRHDIRNRITVLLGLLPLLQDISDDHETEEILKIFSTAVNSINDQIEFTRVYQDLGVHVPVWQEISLLIKKALSIGIPESITVTENIGSVSVYSDPMLERVFYNLIDNSLRYGGENLSRISFSYEYKDDYLCIIYEDDGVGVEEDIKEEIFKQGYGRNTGLGLFLAREILSITRIAITEDGIPGKGVRFIITIPEGFYTVKNK